MLDYLNSLLQPWRRVPRMEFVIALTILSLPGLVLMLGGLLEGGSGMFGPLLAAREALQGAVPTGLPQAGTLLPTLTGPAAPSTALANTVPHPFDATALVNALCLLLVTPYVRGRLLDLGWAGSAISMGVLLLQASVLVDAAQALAGFTLPYGWVLQGLTMVGYLALSILGSRARPPVHTRMFQPNRADPDDFPRL